ncbi:hypothetical protein K440DRAFT_620503 [Wilcoxina mikolae CBS 423.85]|nr:hypothetical protein K440DRAFT_620503 [Wilcoxina mikolae CBS 423.85]
MTSSRHGSTSSRILSSTSTASCPYAPSLPSLYQRPYKRLLAVSSPVRNPPPELVPHWCVWTLGTKGERTGSERKRTARDKPPGKHKKRRRGGGDDQGGDDDGMLGGGAPGRTTDTGGHIPEPVTSRSATSDTRVGELSVPPRSPSVDFSDSSAPPSPTFSSIRSPPFSPRLMGRRRRMEMRKLAGDARDTGSESESDDEDEEEVRLFGAFEMLAKGRRRKEVKWAKN